jgi:hypothetical protein
MVDWPVLKLGYSFHNKLPITDGFVNALLGYKKSPKLHLLGEDGRTRVNTKMPFVRNCILLSMPELELPETVRRQIDPELTHRSRRLVLSENATFQPLKSLSLSGFPIKGDEEALWRDRFS